MKKYIYIVLVILSILLVKDYVYSRMFLAFRFFSSKESVFGIVNDIKELEKQGGISFRYRIIFTHGDQRYIHVEEVSPYKLSTAIGDSISVKILTINPLKATIKSREYIYYDLVWACFVAIFEVLLVAFFIRNFIKMNQSK